MPKSVTCRMSGGLGNQLFMYAAGRALSDRSGADLILDIQSGYESDHKYRRSFLLSNYQIKARFKRKSNVPTIITRIIRRLKIAIKSNVKYYYQKTADFDSNFNNLTVNSNLIIEGYWQSEKYFIKIKDKIIEELNIKKYNYAEEYYKWRNIITSVKCIAIHFRFYEDKNGNLDRAYYLRAHEYLIKNLNSYKFLIFTDDLDKYIYNFSDIFENALIISEDKLSEIEEFELMRLCKAHIIANSTFSWWAAWLSNSELIIAPNFKKLEGEGAWGFEGLIPDYFVKL